MRKLFFLFIIFCLVSPVIFGQNITFVGTTEKVVVVGQQFRLSYTLTTGSEKGKDFRFPDIKDFNVIFGPTISDGLYSQYINGVQSTQITSSYIYVLTAKSEGTFTIPPATIKVGNSEYKSNEISIKVLPPDKAAQAVAANSDQQGGDGQTSATDGSSNDVFVRAQVSKNSVYENEGFLVTFKLYTLIRISGPDGAPKFPEYDGFVAQEIDMPANVQMTLENYNGRNYQTAVLKQTILYPQRSGKIIIPSGKMDVVVQVRTQQRQRSIFDSFLDMTQDVKRTLTSSPVTIDVKPLPQGKPASFSGAVGD